MPSGRLKTWKSDLGWGFLETDRHGDVFVHVKQMSAATSTPHIGQHFTFVISPGRSGKRPEAMQVKLMAQEEVAEEQQWSSRPIKFGEMPNAD